jgi:hypothetical protein
VSDPIADDYIDAEWSEDKGETSAGSVVQVTSELEIERLKTKRAELATKRTKARVEAIATAVVLIALLGSCTQLCSPWLG